MTYDSKRILPRDSIQTPWKNHTNPLPTQGSNVIEIENGIWRVALARENISHWKNEEHTRFCNQGSCVSCMEDEERRRPTIFSRKVSEFLLLQFDLFFPPLWFPWFVYVWFSHSGCRMAELRNRWWQRWKIKKTVANKGNFGCRLMKFCCRVEMEWILCVLAMKQIEEWRKLEGWRLKRICRLKLEEKWRLKLKSWVHKSFYRVLNGIQLWNSHEIQS